MSRRTSRVQRKVRMPTIKKRKSSTEKKNKDGVIPCCIAGCGNFADKHLGGRSLSQENAIDTWGEGGFTVRKNRVRVCKSCYKVWKKDNKDDKTPNY